MCITTSNQSCLTSTIPRDARGTTPHTAPHWRSCRSRVVGDSDGGVVGPAGVVGLGSLGDGGGGPLSQAGGGHVEVDPPAGVVVEGLASVGPPGVRAGAFGVQAAHYVDVSGVVVDA